MTPLQPSNDNKPWELTAYILTGVIGNFFFPVCTTFNITYVVFLIYLFLIILITIIAYGVRKFKRRHIRQFQHHAFPLQEIPKDHSA